KLPLPHNIIGEMLRYIISHEVGHTLGLRHNHKASQAFTIEQLRDPAFTSEYGDTASIMSYGRLNYVAQPEDNVTRLIPMIGPYDRFAIRWGYKPVPGATSAMDERITLDSWAAEGVENPWLLFGGEDDPSYTDPTVHTENIGSDRINATALGIKNLERVMGYLVPATVSKGQDFSKLGTMYDAVLSQRLKWLGSVAKLVGGVEETRTLAGRGDVQFRRVPKERQEQAVEFLMENLRTPKEFMPTDVIDNITSSGATKEILASQELILYGLLNAHRYQLLAEEGILEPASAYNLSSLLGDVQDGVWEELSQDSQDRIHIDPVRRDLQRYHLSLLQDQLAGKDNSAFALAYLLTIGLDLKVDRTPGDTLDISSDFRPAAMSSLKELRGRIETARQKGADEDTRRHLEDCRERIDEILIENVPGNASSLSAG
ncbi:MAG: zinc-dependent metalloprotease, partial [Methanothrix sp.]|nr:zinc-dependent metalloprotease [Methanothrix sp.]